MNSLTRFNEMGSLTTKGLLVDKLLCIIEAKNCSRLSAEELFLFNRLFELTENVLRGIDGVNSLTVFPNMEEALDALKIVKDALSYGGGPEDFTQIGIYLASIRETITSILTKQHLEEKDIDVLEPFLLIISRYTSIRHKELMRYP